MYKAVVKYGRTPSAQLARIVKPYLDGSATIPSAPSTDGATPDTSTPNTPPINKRASGTVAAIPESYDSTYYSPILIGNPPQRVVLDFDSGSADLWVFSSLQPSTQSKGHNTYKSSSSNSSRLKTGNSWAITYGDGSSAKGNVYLDTVTLGGVSVTNQAVEAATDVSGEFITDTNIDGILGLAFSSLNTIVPAAQKTWFENVKSSLDSPLWTADLKRGAAGTYGFGKINTTAYTGKIYYVNVDSSNGFWGFTIDKYKLGTGSYVSSAFSGIADTGTSLNLFPATVVKAYYTLVSGSTYSNDYVAWLFPCKNTLPDFTFTVGGGDITIPGRYLNYAPINSTYCYGSIQPDDSVGITIFGDVALKSAYVVFESNGNTPRLGWAKKTLG
ncbi:acid protease [Thozetella sp. PMI_491]|nr:acid protease [Thozetella sp. PMI_491]